MKSVVMKFCLRGWSRSVILDDRPLDLIAERAHVALQLGLLANSSTLTARKLASAPRHVWGTPAYFARSGVPATPTELTGHQTIVFTQDWGGGNVWRFRQGDHEISVNVSRSVRVSAAEGMRAAVLAAMGAGDWLCMDVQPRAFLRRSAAGAGGLVPAALRSLDSLPDRPHAQCQGEGFCGVCRGGIEGGGVSCVGQRLALLSTRPRSSLRRKSARTVGRRRVPAKCRSPSFVAASPAPSRRPRLGYSAATRDWLLGRERGPL